MENAFVNAFAALEPSTGHDGFSNRQAPRKPAGFAVRQGVNRLFRSNSAVLATLDNAPEAEASEAATFVVGEFLKRPAQF